MDPRTTRTYGRKEGGYDLGGFCPGAIWSVTVACLLRQVAALVVGAVVDVTVEDVL